ncbi:MAG: ABC transporter permease [Candidatus Magasanikbacteria bacterium]|jgi:peptide/nickel transport system permease protein|nr:ABC transporter permease [Rhodospirillaceae bacterium]MBT7755497.1 ABC transporter permease [Candidatus Magasanikbacteria bacterium]
MSSAENHVGGWVLFFESFKRFLSSKLNRFSFVLILLLFALALAAPWISPFPFDQVNPANGLKGPSWEHLMGTDNAGRDIFSRVLYGARTSLSIAMIAVIFGLITGVFIGAVSGYVGGMVDEVIMRIVEIFMSIPGIVMALALVSVLGPSLPFIILALSIRRITQFARVTRGAVLSVKTQDYVTACHAIGMSNMRIVFGHVLPNCIGPIIVLATVLIGNVILTESTLSFLGMGIQEPTPSWGTMIAQGNEFLTFAPWLSIFPGLFLFLTMIAFNLLGDGMRDHLDPRGGSVV